MTMPSCFRLGRRAFLTGSTLLLGGLDLSLRAADAPVAVTFGLITDLHYADRPPSGTRHYRESLSKLAEAGKQFATDRTAFVVELGDLIDAADSVATEQSYLKRISRAFAAVADERHHVLGNHCVDTLTKPEFLDGVGQKQSYYSFDRGGVHFIVLDACFRSDSKPYGRKNSRWNDALIPAAEIDWLRADLEANDRPVVVFAHQRLDVANNYGIKNAAAVRQLLERSGRVRAVFQGHSHKNDYRDIAGIHYCTLVAMVEGAGPASSGYATARLRADGSLAVSGFRKQNSYTWTAKRR